MVGKLMKYEFLRTRYPLALAAGIGLAICALAYLLALLAPVVAMVPFVVGFVMGLIFTFAVQIYLAVDFYRSSFGRRGYFTHSLPVTGTMLVLTKLGHALLVTLAAMIWSAALLLITLSSAVELGMITYGAFWSGLRDVLGSGNWFTWFMVLNILAIILITLVQYFFSVAVGSESWINKAGALGPVVTFLIVYVAVQILSFVALLIPPSYDPLLETWSWSPPLVDMLSGSVNPGIPLSAFWVGYALSAVLLWRTVVSVNRKLELR